MGVYAARITSLMNGMNKEVSCIARCWYMCHVRRQPLDLWVGDDSVILLSGQDKGTTLPLIALDSEEELRLSRVTF